MGFDPLKKAQEFHQKYGGDNGVIDAPEEVTPEMAKAFYFKETDATQYLILAQMLQKAGGEISKTQIGNLRLFAGPEASICQNKDEPTCEGLEGIFWQFQNDLAVGANAASHPRSDKQGLAWLILNVVEGGELKTVAISREELEKNGYNVNANGYVEGALAIFKNKEVLYLGDKEGHASCDDCLMPMTKAEPLTRPADKYFPEFSLLPGNAACQFNLLDAPMPAADKANLLKLLAGGNISTYGSILFAQGFNKAASATVLPLSVNEDVRIQIGGVEGTGSIHIRQQGVRVHDRFHYMASAAAMQALGEKVRSFEAAVAKGINVVEQNFPGVFNGRVIVTEKNVHQANSFLKDIAFTTHDIDKKDDSWLLMTTEHEILHQVAIKLGFVSNGEIRDKFKKTPAGLMKFISENEFFGTSSGGHPYSDMDEFCTSFIHTVMYPDRLKANLEKLPPDERKAVAEQYRSVLKLFKSAAPERYKHLF